MESAPVTPSNVVLTQPGFFLKREKHLEDDNWISKPLHVSKDIPIGLEVLSVLDELTITRNVDKGTICGGELQYTLFGRHGKQAFSGEEESTCCCVFFCGPSRSYTVRLNNKSGTEILKFLRPYRCDGECTLCCCCPFSMMKLDIASGYSGEKIGTVAQKLSCFKNEFEARTKNTGEKYTIQGRALPCRCCMSSSFKILNTSGDEVGQIWKRRNQTKTRNTRHETFGVTFPLIATVEMKATLIGATFLLNHTYFEMS